MPSVSCPECGATLPIGKYAEVGAKVVCPQCGAKLEVINANPPEVDWVFNPPAPEEQDKDWILRERVRLMENADNDA
ncbi:MAG: hypothetical protein H5T65_07730 [Chloroflexi bacterium]|nr:hypothetical protein [Chloroflexota bacterium]